MNEGKSQILVGDCLDVLKTLPAGSVQTCVTSPPYWGLRDYGIPPRQWGDGTVCAFGLESTPELFIAHAVDVFREVRRVLRDDGTLWLNLGDSYAQDSKWGGRTGGKHAKGLHGSTGIGRNRTNTGLKSGDLCNIPHRVAAALQADGWFWRSTIIWSKRAPMPESITGWRWVRCRVKVASHQPKVQAYSGVGEKFRSHSGGVATLGGAKWNSCPGCRKCENNGGYILRRGKWRPTASHEYVFLLSKSERYYCDGDASQEQAVGGTPGNKRHKGADAYRNGDRHMRTKAGLVDVGARETRNPRSVWTFSSEPYKGAHFATYPTELPRRAITAATSAAGCCPECGTCCAPIVEFSQVATRPGNDSKVGRVSVHEDSPYQSHNGTICGNRDPKRHTTVTRIIGYRPSCTCNAGDPVPCVVLDPFGGSGTTGQVAHAMGRRYVLIEVNPDYVELIRKRVEAPLRAAKSAAKQRSRKSVQQQLNLFG